MSKWRLLIAGLSLFAAYPSHAAPWTCHPGAYIELEPFLARARDDWSDFVFARSISTPDHHARSFRFHGNDWDWGFRVALGYDFKSCSPCYYWGASAEYTYFQTDDHRHTPEGVFLTNLGSINTGIFTSTDAHIDTDYDAVDALAHFHYIFRCWLQTDWFAGLRYARLDETIHINNHGTVVDSFEHTTNLSLSRKFDGIGPRIGLGLYAPVYCNFALTGDISGSFLRGDREHILREHFETAVGNFGLSTDGSFRDHDDNQWVPNIGAHLGLAYKACFCNCSSLILEAGYRYDKYFDILESRELGCHCNDNLGRRTEHDFIFEGPYIKATWHF